MSGRETRDRQVMTLLVQLFGREVMDRLAGAGFETPAAMARAGADRLAAEAGIPIAIARRVAIVVEESPGPAPATPRESAARTAPAPQPESAARKEPGVRPEPAARSKPVERDESEMLMEPATRREPIARPDPAARTEPAGLQASAARDDRRPAKAVARKRGEPRTEVVPETPPVPTVPPPAASSAKPASSSTAPAATDSPAAPASSAAPSAASTGRGSFLDEGDPFVDDVALVSWMGLSSHQPDGRLAFTVSDTILDPPGDESQPPAERDAAEPTEPVRPRPPVASPVEPAARPSTLSGSFWTFGRPADPTTPPTGPKPEPQSPATTPRRRKHDGH